MSALAAARAALERVKAAKVTPNGEPSPEEPAAGRRAPSVPVREPDVRRSPSVGVREAGDDHFYGAWQGGAKAEGGHADAARAAADKEAEDRARVSEISGNMSADTGWNTYVDLKGCTPEHAEAIAEAWSANARDFPVTAASVRSVAMDPRLPDRDNAVTSLYPPGALDTGPVSEIALSAKAFGDPKFDGQLRWDEMGRWSAVGTVQGVIDHEFGHAVMHANIAKADAFMDGLARRMAREAPEGGYRWRGRALSAKSMVYPSRYSRAEVGEHFAELFAAARSGRPDARIHPAARVMRAWLREERIS